MIPEFTQEEKKRFALAWVNNENPFEAALSLFDENDHAGRIVALKMASYLPRDSEVLKAVEELRAAGEDLKNLPSKGSYARDLWNTAQSLNFAPEEKIKYMRLLGETLGYIVGKNNVEVTNTTNQFLPAEPTYTVVNE